MKIRKIAAALAVVTFLGEIIAPLTTTVVYAEEDVEKIVVDETLSFDNDMENGVMDFSSIKKNSDLQVVDFELENPNICERSIETQYSVDMAQALSDNESVNDNPNSAYLINLGEQLNGTVSAELEQRWYAFSVDKKTKFTAAMAMDAAVDFDLYLFKLNESESTLELVGGSAVVGNGESELAMCMLDAGTYFMGIEAESGFGSYSVFTYSGVNDDKEMNDSTDTASSYKYNTEMRGTIDSPYDTDFYKFTIGTNDILEFTFNSPSGYDYQALLFDGSSFYNIDSGNYRLKEGTYYIVVRSNTITCSDNEYYKIKIHKFKMADDSDAVFMWYVPDKSLVFQFDGDRTNFYVNGNPIDFTFSKQINSGGNIYMNLYKTSDQNVVLFERESVQVMGELPTFIDIRAPFSSSGALVITVFNTRWIVNSYSSEYSGFKSNVATLIIDSGTGKVLDVMTPHPIYDEGVVLRWTRRSGVTSNYNHDPLD